MTWLSCAPDLYGPLLPDLYGPLLMGPIQEPSHEDFAYTPRPALSR